MKTKILMTTLLCCAMIVAASQAEEIGGASTRNSNGWGQITKLWWKHLTTPKLKVSRVI